MREVDVNTIVFSSSCAVYGQPEIVPITEETPSTPLSPYGRNKAMIEDMLADYSHAYGFRFVSCRYFNACGADPGGELGEEHDPETHVIPRLLMAASGEAPSFEIYGSDYETRDGTCIRDYIHVQDLARAHILALEYLVQGGQSRAINLGSGAGYSVKDIIQTVENVTGHSIKTIPKPRRSGDPPVLLADVNQAKEILGFHAQDSDIEHIVETAWNFYKNARVARKKQQK